MYMFNLCSPYCQALNPDPDRSIINRRPRALIDLSRSAAPVCNINFSFSGSTYGRRNIGPIRDGLRRAVPAATKPAYEPPAASAAPPELRLLALRVHNFSDVPLAARVHHVERLRLPPHDDAPLRRRRRLQPQVC